MPTVTYRCCSWVTHHTCITVIISQTTNQIGKLSREIKTMESNGSAKTTIQIRIRISTQIKVACRISGRCFFLIGFFIRIIPQWKSVLRQTGKTFHIPCIDRQILTIISASIHISSMTIHNSSLFLIWQISNLILIVCQIQIYFPCKILFINRNIVQFQFNTLIRHIADIIIVPRITQRKRNIAPI